MQFQKKAYPERKKAKNLPHPHVVQGILYLMNKGDCLPGNLTQVGPDLHSYTMTSTLGAKYE